MSLPTETLRIRDAHADDIAAMQSIYAWHVLYGCASFEETPPDDAEMRARLLKVQSLEMPWLVAEQAGRLLGYCYAAPYRPRPAYRYTLEESIYLRHDLGGRGIGSALLAALIARCEEGPWRQMLAVVGSGRQNGGSLHLHLKLGFREVGVLQEVGFKGGAWRDTLIMQRALSPATRAEE